MKEFLVRLRDYKGFIIDGGIYNADCEDMAKMQYLARCVKLGIVIGKDDYITVEKFA